MYPYQDDSTELFGFADRWGNWRIPPQFVAAIPFSGGLARVSRPDESARIVINSDGQLVAELATAAGREDGVVVGADTRGRLICVSRLRGVIACVKSDIVVPDIDYINSLDSELFVVHAKDKQWRTVQRHGRNLVEVPVPVKLWGRIGDGVYCDIRHKQDSNLRDYGFYSLDRGSFGPRFAWICGRGNKPSVVYDRELGYYFIDDSFHNVFDECFMAASPFCCAMAPVLTFDNEWRYLYLDGSKSRPLPYEELREFTPLRFAVVEAKDDDRFIIDDSFEVAAGPFYSADYWEGDCPCFLVTEVDDPLHERVVIEENGGLRMI